MAGHNLFPPTQSGKPLIIANFYQFWEILSRSPSSLPDQHLTDHQAVGSFSQLVDKFLINYNSTSTNIKLSTEAGFTNDRGTYHLPSRFRRSLVKPASVDNFI